MIRVGDIVGYSDGVGMFGLVLGIWSEWANMGWDEEDTIQTWAEVLWGDGGISDHDIDFPGRELEKVNGSR